VPLCTGCNACACHSSPPQEILEEEDTPSPKWTRNANLGRFTNFANLLGMCGVAVPSGVVRVDVGEMEAAGAGLSGSEAEALSKRCAHLREGGGATQVTLPFGVTLLAEAWRDEWLWGVAAAMHRASGMKCGPAGHGVMVA
jgi:allophanate hydrolase